MPLTQLELEEGLKRISDIILEQRRNLIPHPDNLPKDILRPDILWRRYSRHGILLTNGGAEPSLFTAQKVNEKYGSTDYSQYRSDRPQSITLKTEEIKRFLVEENLIPDARKDEVFTEFALGSHEGLTRVMRVNYKDGENTGMIYPVGGYGLIIRSVALMKPTSYSVHLVDVDRGNGERILMEDLEMVIKSNPKAKTLYLESKNTCGAVYKKEELAEVVQLCKKHDLFFILDTAHNNMEFEAKDKFPNAVEICLEQNYKKFAILTTGSKTYALERGRVGFIVLGDKELATEINRDLFKTVGALGDWQAEVAQELISNPLRQRQEFLDAARDKHRFNKNLMIAYIEGADSLNIDEDLRGEVVKELPEEYRDGIDGLEMVYNPEAGIQLKVSMNGLREKYFSNIRMFNSEIFGYTLSATCNVSILNSYQIMDAEGSGIRLSFSIKEDVHKGMQKIHDFVNVLSREPKANKYMPGIASAEDFIFPTEAEIDKVILDSRSESQRISYSQSLGQYRENITSKLPKFFRVSEEQLDDALSAAADTIQGHWQKHRASSLKKDEASPNPSTTASNTSAEPVAKRLRTERVLP